MAECGRLKKYLHLPVQSGSDRILKLMNRGYTRAQYLKLVDEYRKIIPKGMISTDVIVGFPTEAEAEFLETFDLMKKVRFDSAYLFKYSPRPNTKAAQLLDDVPETEKKRRHKALLDYQKGLHSAGK
jgi:tRNA-2-methylthio-N6-dimethylallyladenosine synthase